MINLFISTGRVFKAGLLNFFRNLWLSMAATAIMVVTLVIILTTIAVNKATRDTLEQNAKEITISAYLFDEITEEQRLQLQAELERSDQVNSVNFISKEEAEQIYVNQNQDDAQLLLDALEISEAGLPASFEIELFDLSENSEVIAIANSDRYSDVIESFDFERLDVVNTIGNAQRFITRAGLGAAVVFGLISVLVIFNTIRMAIFTRNIEIKIMQLIGATNNYIRGPFLVESAMYGVIAGTISLIAVYPFITRLLPSIDSPILFGPTGEFFVENAFLIVPLTIVAGILIGVVSSLFAMSRYLRLRS